MALKKQDTFQGRKTAEVVYSPEFLFCASTVLFFNFSFHCKHVPYQQGALQITVAVTHPSNIIPLQLLPLVKDSFSCTILSLTRATLEVLKWMKGIGVLYCISGSLLTVSYLDLLHDTSSLLLDSIN